MTTKRDSLMLRPSTKKRFKELQKAYAQQQELGKVPTDFFLGLLMNEWELMYNAQQSVETDATRGISVLRSAYRRLATKEPKQ